MSAARPPADPAAGIGTEAAEWLLTMNGRTVSLQDRARFEAWLAADPEHARVYRAQRRAWTMLAGMPHLLEEAVSGAAQAPAAVAMPASGIARADRSGEASGRSGAIAVRPRARRLLRLGIAACLVLGILGSSPLWRPLLPFGERVYRTGIAQVRDIALEDGSLVTLGAASRISVDFDRDERRVVLAQGEAFFEVARDTARPFRVAVGDTLVRVVGTKFEVRRGADAVRVSVLEGRVEVSRNPAAPAAETVRAAAAPAAADTPPGAAADRARRQVLTAGEAVTADRSGALAGAAPVNLPDVGAWRSGRLVYVDACLRDIVADLNRYQAGRIEIADPALGELQLTATFRADQIDGMLSVLTRALPVDAHRVDAGRIVLTSRR